jgi:hypothetical protein
MAYCISMVRVWFCIEGGGVFEASYTAQHSIGICECLPIVVLQRFCCRVPHLRVVANCYVETTDELTL